MSSPARRKLVSASDALAQFRAKSAENEMAFREAVAELAAEWRATPTRTLHYVGQDEIRVRAAMTTDEMIGHGMACWSLSGRINDYEIVKQGSDLRMRLRREVSGG